MKNQNVVFYTIRGSTIKKFIILDCMTGTGIYYALKFITSSIIVGIVGSMVCTESLKNCLVRSVHK
jgi:hypothetical protein